MSENPPSARPPPHFYIPLNLPHAGRVMRRIVPLLPSRRPSGDPAADTALAVSLQLVGLLDPCLDSDENPPGREAAALRDRAAVLGRQLVAAIELGGFGHDRLGQCIRNFFECLELGIEGAQISLRAGEDPQSLQRPT